MNWFAQNASAIQAIASMVGVLITAVLAYITYQYVQITRDISKSSTKQLDYMRDALTATQKRNAQALGALAARIRNSLGRLDADAPRFTQLKVFAQVNDDDGRLLEALAWQLGSPVIMAESSTAINAMRDSLEIVEWQKEKGAMWASSNEQITRWRRALENSDRSLKAIETECERLTNS